MNLLEESASLNSKAELVHRTHFSLKFLLPMIENIFYIILFCLSELLSV